ncbi:MAG: hypothetical protein JXR94_02435 [Candidatus Hydrogenedentes bacterium]|nr:hypothetical protein [Candidatus Hydrogenedentota bacterium]
MSDDAIVYRQLRGRCVRPFIGQHRLWLGPDHVLLASDCWFTQSYRRFYFSDIQAFTLHRTDLGKAFNAVLATVGAGLSLVAVAVALAGGPNLPALAAAALFALLFFLPLMLNIAAGPTCRCSVHTATHTELLLPLGRLRTAQQVLDLLRPLIEGVQGVLTAEALAAGPAAAPGGDAAAPGAGAPRTGPLRVDAPAATWHPTRVTGRIHQALFLTVLCDVPICLMDLYLRDIMPPAVSMVINMIWLLAVVALTFVALVQLQHGGFNDAVQTVTWLSLAYALACVAVVYVLQIQSSFGPFSGAYEEVGPPLLGDGFYVGVNVVAVVLSAALGISGLILVRDWRRGLLASGEEPAQPAPPPGGDDGAGGM